MQSRGPLQLTTVERRRRSPRGRRPRCSGGACGATGSSFGTPTGPSADHPFGVDPLGRDVLVRVVYGARVSLQVALIATTTVILVIAIAN